MAHISLEQWQCLIAVVDAGGYAQAAEKLCKSQSAITYAVQKIDTLLDVKTFEIQGRKAILTPTGKMLYRRALALISDAHDLEIAANKLSAGWEPVIYLAAEILFPSDLLLTCLEKFGQESPYTRIELIESVMNGTTEALLKKEVDLVISPQLPTGFLGELLMRVELIAVAHANHPLQRIKALTSRDLKNYRHIVVRDSGINRNPQTATVNVEKRWTVSQITTSIKAVTMGLGFAWLPTEYIRQELKSGVLKPLNLKEGIREVPLYLILANPELAGFGVKRLAAIIKENASLKS